MLAELDRASGHISEWFAPSPHDASFSRREDGGIRLNRLAPGDLEEGQQMDSLPEARLAPVKAAISLEDTKPVPDTPAFWSWSRFESWLREPRDEEPVEPKQFGIGDLLREDRTNLALEPGERVGQDGMLFSTSGLRFLHYGADPLSPRRFALSVRTPGGTLGGRTLALHEETAPLGGERRLARWSKAEKPWPALPAEVRAAIVRSGEARLVLLTPAYFAHGALPGWNGQPWPGQPEVTVHVKAACVGRPEIVSGWDLAAGQPKPTRRLARGGSVYFVQIEGSEPDIAAWCDSTWLSPVSDPEPPPKLGTTERPHPNLDGFGLAALGIWRYQ
jgi:CRISPR-associated protein Cmr3